jgi:uncharacterized protein YgbK (DUF1537 family)
MIVVIADDLTGAAEIGGLGLSFGLKAEIITDLKINPSAELVVISTDTRSMPEEKALEITKAVSETILVINPDIIFIKVDSVLRGHIVPELKLHLQILGYKKALLVSANPAFGRVLTGGKYYVNGELIHKTAFVHDPEFPVKGPHPYQMLRVNEEEVSINSITDELPTSGIVVGETASNNDLLSWIIKADDETLLAGGAGLFKALLKSLGLKENTSPITKRPNLPALFVCGTTHDRSRSNIRQIKQLGGPVSYMPPDIISFATKPSFETWADEIVSLLKTNKKAIIAIDEAGIDSSIVSAADLREKKAMVVEKVFQKLNIKELLVEGGSTAAAIINHLNFRRFFPVSELGAGVIKMKVDNNDLFLTLKPGSYDWPVETWDF